MATTDDYLIRHLTDPSPLDPDTMPDGDKITVATSPAAAAVLGPLADVQTSNAGDPEHAAVLADYPITAQHLAGRTPGEAWAVLCAEGVPGLNDDGDGLFDTDAGPVASLRAWLTDYHGNPRGLSLAELVAELRSVAAHIDRTLAA